MAEACASAAAPDPKLQEHAKPREDAKSEPTRAQDRSKTHSPPSISIPRRPSPESLLSTAGCSSSSRSSTDGQTLAEHDPECRSFSQLLAGAMASPTAAVPAAAVMEMKPTIVLTLAVDPSRFPVVAQPAFIGVLAQGQFGMSHQEALASVTAQAQMQLQSAYSSSSVIVPSNSVTQPVLSTLNPTPLRQRMPSVPEENVSTPETEHQTALVPKTQSVHGNVKTPSTDGYNWRKYGQKQVKSSESSRSYYRCTHANCVAKKKVECSHNGQIAEIVYKGQHNHEPPQRIRCKKETEVPSGGPSGGNETSDTPGEHPSEPNPPSTSKTEQTSSLATPEPQLQSLSNCDEKAATKAEEDRVDEPDPKRRNKDNTVSYSTPLLKTVKEPKVVVQKGSDPGSLDDGYRWRKYGQKIVKGNPNPRSYYKCTCVGCPVRKHVEKASDDEKAVIITYEGKHNHDCPASTSNCDPLSTALSSPASIPPPESTDGLSKTPDVPTGPPPNQSSTEADGKLADEKAKELGGEKALESAQALLSIGFNSKSSEDAGPNNSNAIQRPLFNENSSTVSV